MDTRFMKLYQKFKNGTLTSEEEKELFAIYNVKKDVKNYYNEKIFITLICFLSIVLILAIIVLIYK